MRWVIAAVVLLVACACASGSAGGGDGGDGGPSGGDGGTDPGYGAGTWQLQNVSDTPDTMGFYAQQVFAGDRRLVAWSETDAVDLSDSDVMVAAHQGGAWSAAALTNDAEQNTYSALAAGASAAYLAWSGRPDDSGDYEIYLALAAGSSWSTPMNVTGSFEGMELRRDYHPVTATGPDGDLVIAYLSESIGGDRDGLAEVRLIALKDGVLSDPITALSVPDASCYEADVAVDSAGRRHVLGYCGGQLHHASDEGGGWSSRVIELSQTGIISPVLAADDELHLVFRARGGCGDDSCEDDIYYAPGTVAGDFGPVVSVSADPAHGDLQPAVASRGGRAFVAWRKQGAGDAADDAFLSWSDDGFDFAEPVNLAPGSDATDEQPTDIAFWPDTGAPSVTLLRTFSGSDPLNIDVLVADFAARESAR